VTREVGDGVIEAAKLRQDGCTGVIAFITYTTVGFPAVDHISVQLRRLALCYVAV
jgi:hypothetical protein